LLEKLKKAGFDGVEVPLFEGDVNHYRGLRKELDNQGLKCTTVTVIPSAAKSPISPDPAVRQAGLNHLRWAVEMTPKRDSFFEFGVSKRSPCGMYLLLAA
jgi:D-psicose/D-tagatose/L-ribulose 3-epimerase